LQHDRLFKIAHLRPRLREEWLKVLRLKRARNPRAAIVVTTDRRAARGFGPALKL
jgi:hypothetical protein